MGDEEKGRPLTLRELERLAIREALRRNDGNISATARELGIGRSTLLRRLKEFRKAAEDAVEAAGR
jgi:transcriptional regulator of acetoin/glycerol metabolism